MGNNHTKVFNIQRYCSHDGPGIRTTIFLKGCPLSCQWCSNPESQKAETQILFDSTKCIGCGICKNSCPHAIDPGKQGIDHRCTLCGLCAQRCPSKALEKMGEEMSIDKVLEEVARDESYYQSTGGGVTISGGEPLLHPDYVCELADEIKKLGYNLAIETTGFSDWETAEHVFSKFDLILYDIKSVDDEIHQKYVGVTNEPILRNARLAAQKGYPIIFRIPLMGGINDSIENIQKLADLCESTGVKKVEFLPYHKFGENKYRLLGIPYECQAYTPSLEQRAELAKILEAKGIEVKIGK